MSLPVINETTSFTEVNLPSGKSIGAHPWRVKEEKELLFAIESLDRADENFQYNGKREVFKFLKSCTNDQAKFATLSNTDILKLALDLRRMSKGDTIEYEYPCPHCGTKQPDEVSITKDQKIKEFDASPIVISDDLKFNIKDLPADTLEKLIKENKDSMLKFNYAFMLNSIESIVYKGEVFTEFTLKEMEAFVDQLDPNAFSNFNKEMESKLAEVTLERKYTCIACNKEVDVNFGDLLDFLIF